MSTPYHSKALPQGAILREWRIEEVLGVGGFGIVYRGRGVYFDELVAIKEYFPSAISDREDGNTVRPTDSSSEEIYDLGLRKFVEEAKILWNLSQPDRHPNIVSVRSLFEIHGTAYMVMDFESGVSLSQLLREGRTFDEAGLLALIRPIAEGLDRAHRAGVVHRDIKPANILVNPAGRPVLIDFGSARFDSGQATSTKVTFYTPPYAAIEQYVKTYPQGAWTDIYALGVTLYQCVTGEKPPEVLERLHGGLGEALSAREWPGFSRAFTRAVDAAMAIRPAERPQTIPDWLRLFDLPDAPPADEEATRIQVTAPAPPPPAPVPAPPVETPAPPAAAAPPPPVAEPAEAPAVQHRSPLPMLLGVGVAVALAAGAGAILLRPGHTAAVKPAPAPAASAAPAAGASAASPQAVAQDADALIADAQRIGRPRREIAALEEAKAKIAALGPAQAADEAGVMARDEAAALGREAEEQAREVERTLGHGGSADAASAAAAVRQAKAGLDTADAAVGQAGGGAASLEAAKRALDAYASFAGAYDGASRLFAPIKQREFAALAASARPIAGTVVSLAGASKPWLFASQARKQAYQLLQANATRARADGARLDQLAQTATATTDLKRLDAALSQASSVKQDLNGLYAASYAAAHTK